MSDSLIRLALIGALVLGAAACTDSVTPTEVQTAESRQGDADRGPDREPTIADIAIAAATVDDEEEREFTILVQALQSADLVEALDGRRQLTVFAPTDAAFERLLELLDLSAEALLDDTELLTDVLLYHVAPGRRLAADVLDADEIRTLAGGFVFPVVENGSAFIVDGSAATGNAEIVATDIEASNGVVHVIDEVLVPGEGSTPRDDDDEGEDDGDDEGDDDEGDEDGDDEGDGDEGDDDSDDEGDDDGDDEAEDDDAPTIAEIAVAASSADDEEEREFTILVQALQAADLVDTFDGDRDFTVFAPTDAAFERLLELLDISAEDLLANTELLTAVLLYHVAPGERDAEDVLESERIRTLNGAFLFPATDDGSAFVVDGSAATDDAEIIQTDIEASNGVVHVIDEVLLPM